MYEYLIYKLIQLLSFVSRLLLYFENDVIEIKFPWYTITWENPCTKDNRYKAFSKGANKQSDRT